MLSKEGEIRRDEACLDYAGQDVILYPCHGSKGNQLWFYNHEVWHYEDNITAVALHVQHNCVDFGISALF